MSYPLFVGNYSINGRFYRKCPYQGAQSNITFEDTPDLYENVKEEVKRTEMIVEGPQRTDDPRITVLNGKKWVAEIGVPHAFIGKLLGQNRRALRSLEDDTGCRVKMPRRNENTPCEITSLIGLENVQRCLDRIEMFLEDARKSSPVTHFIALPCDQEEIIENYKIFMSEVLEGDAYDESARNPKLFISPNRLHLTLSVVRLFDEQEIGRALQILQELKGAISEVLVNGKLVADIQGIDIMNDDAANVNVLFAKARGDGLQKVANLVRNAFIDGGLSREDMENDVKLHMTLMNGRYVAQAENKRNYQFDASKILENMSEFYFGTIPIHEICLCPLNSSVPSDKFYAKLGNVDI